MTSASDPGAESIVGLRRLHPFSWVFVLLSQLRQFALPLVALLVFGRGGDWQEIAAGVSAVGLSLLAVWHYFTFTYRVDADALVIRSGLLHRGVRHLPFRRIHNVELRRSVLHRMVGVAEVRVESATGDGDAEAQMQVLALADAEALVACIRSARSGAAVDSASSTSSAESASGNSLLAVSTRDLILLGLSSNRGWVVVGAGLGVVAQLNPRGWSNPLPLAFDWVRDGVSSLTPAIGDLAGLIVLVLLASLLLRLLGTLLVLLRHYGFVLSESESRISVEGGLLTRTTSHTTLPKIQRWLVREPWLLRQFDRRALHVETAAKQAEGSEKGIDALLPIAPAGSIDALLRRFLPGIRWEQPTWHGIHPLAWRRTVKPPLLLLLVISAAVSVHLGPQAVLLLLLAPLLMIASQRDAAFSAYSVDAQRVLWRSGWLQRRWHIVERERIQCVRLRQSWFDRRAGMAHVDIDSAGARNGSSTTLGYLAVADARHISARLRRWLAQPALLAPEGGREQDQDREHLESTEQHAERAQPDSGVTDRAEGVSDLAQTGTQVGKRRDHGTESGFHIEASGDEPQPQQHGADHPQGDKSADR